jgi:hypothetical protein
MRNANRHYCGPACAAAHRRQRPQAVPVDRRLRLGREEAVDFVAGLFVLSLMFVALFYALPVLLEAAR